MGTKTIKLSLFNLCLILVFEILMSISANAEDEKYAFLNDAPLRAAKLSDSVSGSESRISTETEVQHGNKIGLSEATITSNGTFRELVTSGETEDFARNGFSERSLHNVREESTFQKNISSPEMITSITKTEQQPLLGSTNDHPESSTTITSSSTTEYSKRRRPSKRIDVSWLFPDVDELDNVELKKPQNIHDFVKLAKRFETDLKDSLDEIIRAFTPHILRSFYGRVEISADCLSSLWQYLNGFKDLKGWAWKLLDSNGFYPGGYVEGRVTTSFGDYDKCLHTIATREDNSPLFTGKYCSVEIRYNLPPKPRPFRPEQMFANFENDLKFFKELDVTEIVAYSYIHPYRFGLCIPSSCTKDDLQNMINIGSNYFPVLNFTVHRCETKENRKRIDGPIIFCIVLLCSIVCLVLIATLVDSFVERHKTTDESPKSGMKRKHSNGVFIELCQALSVTRNGKKIFDTSETSYSNLRFLYGIRFFSISWILCGHLYYYRNIQRMGDFQVIRNLGKDVWFQLILNGSFAVDAFFLMSGFLLVFLSFEKMDVNGGKFNYVLFYISRIWRLTPTYMLVIAFIIIIPICGSGPLWEDTMDALVKPCREKWWTNLLFINNFIRLKDMCLSPSWYLAATFQYFLLSGPILAILYRKPNIGLTILTFLTLLSMTLSGVFTFIWNLPPAGIFTQSDQDERNDYFLYMYQTVYNHGAPYFSGMVLGYFLYKNKEIKIKPVTKYLGWMVSTLLCMSVIYSLYPWNRGDDVPEELAAVYAAFSRAGWSLGLAWIFFACFTGNGGVANAILSIKPLIPLGRLTFCVYLIHVIYVYLFDATTRNIRRYSAIVVFYDYASLMFLSYFSGFLCCVFFESPFMGLEKLLFSKLGGKRKNNFKELETNGFQREREREKHPSKNCEGLVVSSTKATVTDKDDEKSIPKENDLSNTSISRVSVKKEHKVKPENSLTRNGTNTAVYIYKL